jgi:predicted ester cyclase
MSEENRIRVRRWFQEVWCEKNAAAIDELMAPDALGHGLGEEGGATQGRREFKEFHQKFCRAFPDLQIRVEEVLAERDLTAVRFTVSAAHTGEGLELPPTGREVSFTGMVFSRWRDGKIVEGWNLVDFPMMMQQLTAS